jgi:hypothetical protein
VIRRDTIELHAGSSKGFRAGYQAVGVLALVAILSSSAEPMWVMMALCALGTVHLASNRMLRRSSEQKRLVLRADGRAIVYSMDGIVLARRCVGGWVSRWCSVVTLEELLSGRRLRCLICRSRNSRDDYRRLLVNLRMETALAADRTDTWL